MHQLTPEVHTLYFVAHLGLDVDSLNIANLSDDQ